MFGVARPHVVVAALMGELRRRSPMVLVIEDLHWADAATLDALRLLGRRVGSVPASGAGAGGSEWVIRKAVHNHPEDSCLIVCAVT